LVFSHAHNTFDKKRLLEDINPDYTKESDKTIDMFIKEPDMLDFYLNRIEEALNTYDAGRPNMKPDVIKQMVLLEKERKAQIQKHKAQQQPTITFKQENGASQTLTMEQVVGILQQQQAQIINLTNLLQARDGEIKILKSIKL
jgi:hypothetical protein